MTAVYIAVGAIALAGLILLILLCYGIIFSFHPMKRAKEWQIRVACVGDSITYGFMVGNWFKNNYPAVLNGLLGKNYCVNNFSYTDRTAIKSGDLPLVNEKVYAQSLAFKPQITVILLGTNDSKEINWNEEKFVADYGEIIQSYLALGSKVYVLIPPPVLEVRGKVLYKLRKSVIENEIIPATKRLAQLNGVETIDIYRVFEGRSELFVDGVHPNAKGSRLIAKTVYEAIKK